ncbi:hypothetical protein V6N13_125633 [Hibiscus sabdariffa]
MLLEPERFSIQLGLNSSLLLLLVNDPLLTHAELEADMSAKLADVEKQYNECSSSLNWHKERTKELETKLTSVQEKGSRELGKLKLSREHQLLAIHVDDSRRRWCLVILSIA